MKYLNTNYNKTLCELHILFFACDASKSVNFPT